VIVPFDAVVAYSFATVIACCDWAAVKEEAVAVEGTAMVVGVYADDVDGATIDTLAGGAAANTGTVMLNSGNANKALTMRHETQRDFVFIRFQPFVMPKG